MSSREAPRNSTLIVRVNAEQKALVVQAAEREGLQISSFILMLLVRLRILPDSSLKKIKRRPVPFFNELHGLLGVVNNIGGNGKQLAEAMPNTEGLEEVQACTRQAADALTDALCGKPVAATAGLNRLEEELRRLGHEFNQIVRSVNHGRPELGNLPTVLVAIRECLAVLLLALTGSLLPASANDILEQAMEEMRTNMQKNP